MTTTNMHDLIAAKKAELAERLEATKAKLDKETAIMGELKVVKGEHFEFRHVVIQKGPAWIGYQVTGSWEKRGNPIAAIRELYEAYKDTIVGYVDYKGTFRGRTPECLYDPQKDGDIVGRGTTELKVEARAHVNISASQSARFCFWARLDGGRLVYVYLDIDKGTWAHYDYPNALLVDFRSDRGSGWSYVAPDFLLRRVSYATGAERQGTGANIVYMLEDADDVADLLNALEG